MGRYDDRYGDNWTQTSKRARFATNNKCVLCDRPANATHHALYQDKDGLIVGREIPGIHVFPLCSLHHLEAHNYKNWRTFKRYPERYNKNTPTYYLKLREGWKKKTKPIKKR